MSNWALKSGYYHVLLHPKFRKYFGVRIESTVLRLNVVFFGYAQACYVFTKIMQEPCFELRAANIPVSNYVDDGFTAAATRLACLWQAIWAVLLQAALGAHHGLAKCQIEQVLLIKWLGFLVDSQEAKFEVAASKVAKLKESLQKVLAQQSVSARDLAQVAGRIISRSPAVAPASLSSRTFFQAIKGSATWDALFPNPVEVRQTLQFWLSNVDNFNGRPWWPRQVALHTTVDASGVGFGGVLSAPPLPPSPSKEPSRAKRPGGPTLYEKYWDMWALSEWLHKLSRISLRVPVSVLLATTRAQFLVSTTSAARFNQSTKPCKGFSTSAASCTVIYWSSGFPGRILTKQTPCLERQMRRTGGSPPTFLLKPASALASRPKWICLVQTSTTWPLYLSAVYSRWAVQPWTLSVRIGRKSPRAG